MKQIKALLGIAVVVAAFYVAFKLMPPYYNQLQFQDEIDNETRTQSYTKATEQEIREIIFKKAKEHDIPVTQDQIMVQRAGTDISINVDYVVRVDLVVRPVDLKFHAGSKNKGI
jgi:hypothetical protein